MVRRGKTEGRTAEPETSEARIKAAEKVFQEALAADGKAYAEAMAAADKVYDEARAAARKVRDEAIRAAGKTARGGEGSKEKRCSYRR